MGTTEQVTSPIAAPAMVPVGDAAREGDCGPAAQRFMIRDLDWASYRKISDALGDHHHYRLSYDGQDLELMPTSFGHGLYGRFLARLIYCLTEELGRQVTSCGDMTCEREAVRRAIQPDECFYLENEPRVRGKTKLDFSLDPPPDLALEIDLTTDARRRLDVYAAIGVPEVWRFDGVRVTIYLRNTDGHYGIVDRSRCLPLLTAAELAALLLRRPNETENDLLRLFRQWVRTELEKQA